MDHKAQRDRSRASYFGNVKNRLGSKLPAGISKTPEFISAHCSIGAQGVLGNNVGTGPARGHHQIRNPKLRQYYLKEAAFPAKESMKPSDSYRSDEHGLTRNKLSSSVASLSELQPQQQKKLDSGSDGGVVGSATVLSPSTDAEYDKLMDVEAVPLPDGNVCLLALPSECSQVEGSASLSCLKLFSRYITDRKGVVSGILLVTPGKIFFDPQKSHPLVLENGCEEYVFSCAVDDLSSVSFYADISHIHFIKNSRRCNRCKPEKSEIPESSGKTPHSPDSSASGAEDSLKERSGDMFETERRLTSESRKGSHHCEDASLAEHQLSLEKQLLEPCTDTLSNGKARSLMFVRLRQKWNHDKKLILSKAKIVYKDAWFTMQQERSDEFYAYLSQHRPDLCILEGSEEDDGERDEEDFVLLDEVVQEEEEWSSREGRAGEDWELVTVEDSRPRVLVTTEPDSLSHILSQSVILDIQQVKEICKELPPRTIGHTWQLSYSTDKHGASLKTLYRKLSASDSPVLILIKDHKQQIFGSFLSHPLHPSEKFYGTGETFLFLSHPRFKCFRWTGENSFFIKGDLDSFAIGGGSGHFGLWVDEQLYFGRSSPCFTFNNCSLSETNDFTILDLEAWTFG